MNASKKEILDLIWERPVEIGHWVGFKDLTDLHNEWLKSFLFSDEDQTLQGHRGSYKTSSLALFFALHTIISPNETILFFRKTETDVKEVIKTTSNILKCGCIRKMVSILYGKELEILVDTNNAIHTNLATGIKGSAQIVGLGIGTSITGKHADIVVTDDIVNINDRISQAERERTKLAYMELQNIKNRGGRFINTGTPWHKEDCFSLMTNLKKYDCYSTGLISKEELDHLRSQMSSSLFAANYELKHIADENVLFSERPIGASTDNIIGAYCHVDSAYGGEDYTAFTAMAYKNGQFYIYGRCWHKHIEDCYQQIYYEYVKFSLGKCWTESNADKGFVARDLKRKFGMRMVTYHEGMNKFVKISTYLKAIWENVIFVEGTDEEYISQILDYTEDAEHDDCPDSASCLAMRLYKKAGIRLKIGLNEETNDKEI